MLHLTGNETVLFLFFFSPFASARRQSFDKQMNSIDIVMSIDQTIAFESNEPAVMNVKYFA